MLTVPAARRCAADRARVFFREKNWSNSLLAFLELSESWSSFWGSEGMLRSTHMKDKSMRHPKDDGSEPETVARAEGVRPKGAPRSGPMIVYDVERLPSGEVTIKPPYSSLHRCRISS